MAVDPMDKSTASPPRMSAMLKVRIARKRGAMRLVMAFERVWPLVLPIICVCALFVSLAWFGYFHDVPVWLRIVTLTVFAIGLVWSVAGLHSFGWPDEAAVDRRLERVNAITHQALAAQDDRLESDSSFASALWAEHQQRMAKQIADLRTGPPDADTPRRDPYALRALVALLFVTAFAYSYSDQSGFLGDAFVFTTPGTPAAPARIDAWITPPAYTGRAPIFLTRNETAAPDDLSFPAGSAVTVRVSGGLAPKVAYSVAGGAAVKQIAPQKTGKEDAAAKNPAGRKAVTASTDAARTYLLKPTANGTLAVSGDGRSRSWAFTVIPDTPPEIAFSGDPESTVSGALKLAYTVRDDYGVTKASAEITPADPPAPDAHPLYGPPKFPLALPGSSRSGKAAAGRDLTDHPLAGRQVRIRLVATDGAGQTAYSKTIVTRLPEHIFTNPLSRALVEERRIFALDTNRMPRAVALIDALTTAPEETIANPTHYLLVRTAGERMELAHNDDTMRDAADYLWQIALGIENGDLSLARQRLRDAQKRLSEALKNHASDAEISQRMKELRKAMNNFMREMARQMQKNPGRMAQKPNDMQNVLRPQDLQRMMDQIENLARSGQRDKAEQLLSQLQQMMNNLQAARPRNGGKGSSEMRKQVDKFGELLQRQQQLMNQTYKFGQQLQQRMQDGKGEPLPGQQQEGRNGSGRPMTAEELRQALKELQRRQKGLQNQLGQLQKGLEGMGIKPGKNLGEAGKAMGKAAGALGKGDGERAVGEQGRALQALRDGAQNMMQQMMQAMGNQKGQGRGQRRGDQAGRNDRDPLGRSRSTAGPDFGNQVKVPDEIDIQRAREILNQIRKRLGNTLSPALEKQYLQRLLDTQ